MTDAADVIDLVSGASKPLFATDFDGTLSEIVRRPEDARPAAGAIKALESLLSVGVEVAVISGRPVSYLTDVFPASLDAVLIGQSGLETSRRGVYTSHPELEAVMPDLRAALEVARKQLDGVDVEFKGFSFTLHFRGEPSLSTSVERFAAELAEAHDLAVVPGKMSVEIRVPIEVDKGHAVTSLVDDHDVVLFAGDDIVDVSAFVMLKSLADLQSLSLGISGPETPDEVGENADLVLESPTELIALLHDVAEARRSR